MTHRSTWRKLGWVFLGLAGGVAFVWLVVARLVSKLHERGPCPYALAWLVDNPFRRRQIGPLLDGIGIRPGERVLELGPGPGAFTIAAAQRTEPGGCLVAVDIQPAMIAAVERKVQQAGLTNVETRVASAHELPLDDESVDRAFLVTVLGEIPDRQRALAELRRVLKPGGTLSITEQFMDPDYPLAGTVIRWAQEAGLELAERHGNWWTYTLNFRKPA
jgi:ubiquinone/menaquinone biosynthesis C-methylase UbiE